MNWWNVFQFHLLILSSIAKIVYEHFHFKLWNCNTYIWWIAICQSMVLQTKKFRLNANCIYFHFNKYDIDKRILTKPIHLLHNHKSFKVCIKTPWIFYHSRITLKSPAVECNFLPIKIVYFLFHFEMFEVCTSFSL